MISPAEQTAPQGDSRWRIVRNDGFLIARRLGAGLVVLQAIILGQLSGAELFAGAVTVVAVVLGWSRYQLQIDRLTYQLLVVMLVGMFLLQHLIAPFSLPEGALFLYTPEAHVIARLLISVQLLGLAVYRPSGRPPLWLAGVGAAAIPFASNIHLAEARHDGLVLWIVAFISVAALYCSHTRRHSGSASKSVGATRTAMMVGALLCTVLLGGGSAMALRRYERTIEAMLREHLGQGLGTSRSGFAPSGRLNDVLAWKSLEGERIALRVFGDRSPGYLRGKVFDSYQAPEWEYAWRSWSTEATMHALSPMPDLRGLPSVRGSEHLFQLREPTGAPWERLHLWPEIPMFGFLFAPLGASLIAVDTPQLISDDHQNLLAANRNELAPYSVFTQKASREEVLSDDLRHVLTQVDPDLDERVHQLARSLFADCKSTREKIDRVETWFWQKFRYSLGASIPRGQDPLVYFLTRRPPAHCEFFATGTAILLRIAGVPCRYVTGFVVAEENAVGRYWIARNKDAHAWVEAYDDEARRWVLVESTPAAGVPSPRGDTVTSQLVDSLRQYWTASKERMRTIGGAGLLRRVVRTAWSIPGLVLIIVGSGGLLLWKGPRIPELRIRRAEPRLRGIHRILRLLDRQARKRGLVRGPDETVLQFARRIRRHAAESRWRREIADCYDRYAILRFRGQIESEAVQRLHQAAIDLGRSRLA